MLKKISVFLSLCLLTASLMTPAVASVAAGAANNTQTVEQSLKIVNTYDDSGIYYKTNSSTGNTRRFTDSSAAFDNNTSCLDYGKTKSDLFAYHAALNSEEDGNGYFKFDKINSPTSADPLSNIRIYNPYNGYALFAPKKNATYKITLRYKSETLNVYNDKQINLYGLTGTGEKTEFTAENKLTNVATIAKNTTVTDWTEVSAYFTVGDTQYTSLALAVELVSSNYASANFPTNISIDDVTVEEFSKIVNTYDDSGIYYKTSSLTGNTRRFTDSSKAFTDASSSLDYGKTKSDLFAYHAALNSEEDGNGYFKFDKINSPTSADPLSNIRIYNPYNGYALFVPKKNATYKITLRYKSETNNQWNNKQINLYGLTDKGAKTEFTEDNKLTNVATIAKNTTVDNWTTVTAYFTVGDTQYTSLALAVELVASNYASANFPTNISIDDVTVEEFSKIVNTYDDSGIYYKTSSLTGNTRRFTDSSKAFTDASSSLDYGKTKSDLFAYHAALNSEEDGNGYFKFDKINSPASADPLSSIRIYNPYNGYALFVPKKNATYKITLRYKSEFLNPYNDKQINLYGLTGTGEKTEFTEDNKLINVAAIAKNTTVTDWTEVSAYFTVGDTQYTSLALAVEFVSSSHSQPNYPTDISIDDVTVETVYPLGDVNKDGCVDILDLVRLKKIVAGISDATDKANVNEDSEINEQDLSFLRGIMLGTYTEITVTSESETQAYTASSLRKAFETVGNCGTVNIEGVYSVNDLLDLNTAGKSVIITGGTLDLTAMDSVELGGNIFFKDINISWKDGSKVYAGGHTVTIGDTVNNTGIPSALYGGTRCGHSDNTNLTVLSGNFGVIYGGGERDIVFNNTNLCVGGTVNSDIDASSHSTTRLIFGGCLNGTVNGDTNLTLTGSAKANYAYAGGDSPASFVKGICNLNMCGASVMSLYGGSRSEGNVINTKLNMTSGWCHQVFGGSEHSGIVGSTEVNLTGGTVERRIYGGCYNEYSVGWKSNYYVTGTTTVKLGKDLIYQGNSGLGENVVAAGSRNENKTDEVSSLYIETQDMYNSIQSKIGWSGKTSGYDDLYIAGVKQ